MRSVFSLEETIFLTKLSECLTAASTLRNDVFQVPKRIPYQMLNVNVYEHAIRYLICAVLMNLSFINILSKFNSNTFCLWCCYDDIDIPVVATSLFVSPFFICATHITTPFFCSFSLTPSPNSTLAFFG